MLLSECVPLAKHVTQLHPTALDIYLSDPHVWGWEEEVGSDLKWLYFTKSLFLVPSIPSDIKYYRSAGEKAELWFENATPVLLEPCVRHRKKWAHFPKTLPYGRGLYQALT